MMREITKVNAATSYIKAMSNDSFDAKIAIVIGRNKIKYDVLQEISYDSIPYFPVYNREIHNGKLILANIKGVKCYILNGNFHLYEGYSSQDVVRPIRMFKQLGVDKIILTNHAGAINTEFEPGEIMLINDHINLGGDNPLKYSEALEFSSKFPFMENAYSLRLQDIIRKKAIALDIPLNEGVYIKFLGPGYETPTEVKVARAMGADAIGMGLVYECIAAVQSGMEVAGISCLTNMAAGLNGNHDDIDIYLVKCLERLSILIEGIVGSI